MGAVLPDNDALSIETYLVVAHMDGANAQARIFSAAPLHIQDIENNFPDLIQEKTEIGWDKRTQSVSAARVRKLGALTLKSTPCARSTPKNRHADCVTAFASLAYTCFLGQAKANLFANA